MEKLQDLKISADFADSRCTTNPRNQQKVAFLTYLEKKNLNNDQNQGYNRM